MKNALLINKGSSDNFGDQLIKFTLQKLLEENSYEVDFRDITTFETNSTYNYKLFSKQETTKDESRNPIRALWRWLIKTGMGKSLAWLLKYNNYFVKNNFKKKYDVIVIGGGQLILSNSTFTISMYKWTKFITKNFGNAKKVIFGVGASEEFNFMEKRMYLNAFNNADDIFVRDYQSQKVLEREFQITPDYVPDVAFYISRIHKIPEKKEKKVLVGITDFLVYERYNPSTLTKEEYVDLWIKKVLYYKKQDYIVELFYTTARDLSESNNLKEIIKERYELDINIVYVDNLKELLEEIAKAKIVISGRMHALIIGYAYKCEVVPFIISEKLKIFNQEYIEQDRSLEVIQNEILSKFNKALEE